MICKFCTQPIYDGPLARGYKGRPFYRHGRYLHVRGKQIKCDYVVQSNPHYEKPQCRICHITEPPHKSLCSASGMPIHHAWPSDRPVDSIEYCGVNDETSARNEWLRLRNENDLGGYSEELLLQLWPRAKPQ